MKRVLWGIMAATCLASAPALAHKSKRTDPCGCHHQFGLRHCHMKEKSDKCEAPVSKDAQPLNRDDKKKAGKPGPKALPL